MACDLIVAADDAQLGEPEIRFGSAPVTLLMPFLIGQKKTRELLLTGDLIDAAEAERIGLVNRVVPADRLAAEVDALAERLARVPPDVMAPTKLMLNRAMDAAGFAAAVEMGLDLQSFVNMSETAREFDAIVRARRPEGGARLARPALRRAPRRATGRLTRRDRDDRREASPDAAAMGAAPSCAAVAATRTVRPTRSHRPDGTKVRVRAGPVVP